MRTLIFGGARSGKSRLAEKLMQATTHKVGYIATTDSRYNDVEMSRRIERHQQQRPAHWHTVEEPVHLARAIQDCSAQCDAIMVDCLTLWLSNCLLAEDVNWPSIKQEFLTVLTSAAKPIVLVSNEVGMGIVPMGEINRHFVDEAGFLNQAVAGVCDRVILTAAGLPMVLKGPSLFIEQESTRSET